MTAAATASTRTRSRRRALIAVRLLLACAAGVASVVLSGCGSSVGYDCVDKVCTAKDAVARVELSAGAYTAVNGAATARFTVTRSGESTKGFSVRYTTADASGLAGVDYTSRNGVLRWAADDMTPRVVEVPLQHQAMRRPDRAFTVLLSSPSAGAELGGRARAEVTIQGDSVAPEQDLAKR